MEKKSDALTFWRMSTAAAIFPILRTLLDSAPPSEKVSLSAASGKNHRKFRNNIIEPSGDPYDLIARRRQPWLAGKNLDHSRGLSKPAQASARGEALRVIDARAIPWHENHSRNIHAILDYVVGVALIAAPWFLEGSPMVGPWPPTSL